MRMRIQWEVLALGLTLAAAPSIFGQDNEVFSWSMGPVNLAENQTARLTFANPFCSDARMKLDVIVAFTDLSGRVIQVRDPGGQPELARKRAIVACGEAIQLDLPGNRMSQHGAIIGVLEVIPDIAGTPWVPVNVPLGSLQIGRRSGGGDAEGGSRFEATIVIIPVSPLRRLIVQ